MDEQRAGSSVALLESRGSKGSVQVNGKTIKKNTSCVLSSGDEVVFGDTGNHAYVSFLPFWMRASIKSIVLSFSISTS